MPEKWIQSFIAIGLVWAPTLAVVYLIWRFTEGPRTARRKVLVAGPVFAALLVLVILLATGRTHGSLIGSFWLILLASIILIEVGHALSWPSRRRRAGEPLFVLARSRTRKVSAVLGGAMAILAVAEIVEALLKSSSILNIGTEFLLLAVGLEILGMGMIPARVTEGGLLDFWYFVEWPSIASYQWRDGRAGVESTLITTLRNRRYYFNDLRPLLFRRVEWKVRQEQKETVDSLVQGFVPAANAGPGPRVRS